MLSPRPLYHALLALALVVATCHATCGETFYPCVLSACQSMPSDCAFQTSTLQSMLLTLRSFSVNFSPDRSASCTYKVLPSALTSWCFTSTGNQFTSTNFNTSAMQLVDASPSQQLCNQVFGDTEALYSSLYNNFFQSDTTVHTHIPTHVQVCGSMTHCCSGC
jgi:hypothetical protein